MPTSASIKNLCPLGFELTVFQPKEKKTVTAKIDSKKLPAGGYFAASRLVVPSAVGGNFVIHDLLVDGETQLATATALPASAFSGEMGLGFPLALDPCKSEVALVVEHVPSPKLSWWRRFLIWMGRRPLPVKEATLFTAALLGRFVDATEPGADSEPAGAA